MWNLKSEVEQIKQNVFSESESGTQGEEEKQKERGSEGARDHTAELALSGSAGDK